MISPVFNGIRRFCKAGQSCGRALGKRKQPITVRAGVKGAEHGDGRRKVKNTRQNFKMGYPSRTKGRQLGNMYTKKIKGQLWSTSPIRKEASRRKYMTAEDDKSLAMNLKSSTDHRMRDMVRRQYHTRLGGLDDV
ncbi:hypothetical protein Tco_1553708 [Tanacetum coccineum]